MLADDEPIAGCLDSCRHAGTHQEWLVRAREYGKARYLRQSEDERARRTDQHRLWKARNPDAYTEARQREKARYRERLATDPEFAASEREKARIRNARRPPEKRRGKRPPTPCRDCGLPKGRRGQYCASCLAARQPTRGLRQLQPKPCRDCDGEFQPTGTHAFYCEPCRKEHEALQRKANRAKPENIEKAKARLRKRLATDQEYRDKYYSALRQRKTRRRNRLLRIESQPYRPVQIYERDGWRCHLCQGRIKKGVVVPHPLAPTIDHLVPISAGGADAPSNVRAAHFLCNARRGAGGDVQLLLLA